MNNEPIYNLLNTIDYPEDLRKLNVEQLPEVCNELRQDIIKELCCNPGHFAASLGTVELTVALHYVYNTPYDRIVGMWVIRHTDTRFLRDDGKLSPPTGSWEESVLFLHRRRVNTILSPADMHPILFLLLSAWQLPLLRTEIPTVMS